MIKETVSNDDHMAEIDRHLVFFSRRFSKLKIKRNPNVVKSFKSNFNYDKKMVDRSKFKCYNRGMAGYFASEC